MSCNNQVIFSQQELQDSKPVTKRRRSDDAEKDSEDYKRKRERNNVSVRKSREKSRMKQKETLENVEFLKHENARLNQKVEIMTKELIVLRGIFTSTTEGGGNASSSFAGSNSQASTSGAPMKVHVVKGELGEAPNMEVYPEQRTADQTVVLEALKKDHEYANVVVVGSGASHSNRNL